MGAPPSGKKPTGYRPIALDGGYGWFVVLGSFLIHVFADGFVYSFGVIAESLITVRNCCLEPTFRNLMGRMQKSR